VLLLTAVSLGSKAVQGNVLLADHASGHFFCTRVHTTDVYVGIGAGNKQNSVPVKFNHTSKIKIASPRHVEDSSFESQNVEHFQIAEFAVSHIHEGGYYPSQFQQDVHLSSRLNRVKWSPTEKTKKKFNGDGVHSLDCGIEINADGLVDVEFCGVGKKPHGQTVSIGLVQQIRFIGQSQAIRNAFHLYPKQDCLIRSDAQLDVEQRFVSVRLRKPNRARHIDAKERANARFAVVAFNHAAISFLRKYSVTCSESVLSMRRYLAHAKCYINTCDFYLRK